MPIDPEALSRLSAPVTVVILTLNEARNLRACLESVAGWCPEIFVVDSGSTDGTQAIAERYGAHVAIHAFESHARQWQWALATLPITNAWVLALDADQALTVPLQEEIARKTLGWQGDQSPSGAFINRRQIFRGRWIRHGGYYPKYLLKLFRRDRVTLDESDLVDHHFVVTGPTVLLDHDLVEDNRNEADIAVWIEKHNRYAVRQAREEQARWVDGTASAPRGRVFGTPDERTLFRKRLWNRLPLFVRPFGYFLYRYVIRLGFLDGKEGFIFHYMQAFWYRLLVDINRDELQRAAATLDARAGRDRQEPIEPLNPLNP